MILGELDIGLEDEHWHRLDGLETLARTVLSRVMTECRTDTSGREGEISLLLSTDDHVKGLNRDYRGRDKATNVLSFPALESPKAGEIICEPGPLHLGDVVMAYGVVEREASDQNIDFKDHFIHLLIHGGLHLIGYDHEDDQEAEEMESLEIKILDEFQIANPYDEA